MHTILSLKMLKSPRLGMSPGSRAAPPPEDLLNKPLSKVLVNISEVLVHCGLLEDSLSQTQQDLLLPQDNHAAVVSRIFGLNKNETILWVQPCAVFDKVHYHGWLIMTESCLCFYCSVPPISLRMKHVVPYSSIEKIELDDAKLLHVHFDGKDVAITGTVNQESSLAHIQSLMDSAAGQNVVIENLERRSSMDDLNYWANASMDHQMLIFDTYTSRSYEDCLAIASKDEEEGDFGAWQSLGNEQRKVSVRDCTYVAPAKLASDVAAATSPTKKAPTLLTICETQSLELYPGEEHFKQHTILRVTNINYCDYVSFHFITDVQALSESKDGKSVHISVSVAIYFSKSVIWMDDIMDDGIHSMKASFSKLAVIMRERYSQSDVSRGKLKTARSIVALTRRQKKGLKQSVGNLIQGTQSDEVWSALKRMRVIIGLVCGILAVCGAIYLQELVSHAENNHILTLQDDIQRVQAQMNEKWTTIASMASNVVRTEQFLSLVRSLDGDA